jgi:hypothetical protein
VGTEVGRLPWIIQVDPINNPIASIRNKRRNCYSHRGRESSELAQAKECQQPAEAGKGKEGPP